MTLVDNSGHFGFGDAGTVLGDWTLAQEFTTGPHGYILSAIYIDFATGGTEPYDMQHVFVAPVNAAGLPGDPIASLSREGIGTAVTAGLTKFVRQGGFYLSPNTDYFVVIESNGADSDVSVEITQVTGESGKTGWSIANEARRTDPHDWEPWVTNRLPPIKMKLEGHARGVRVSDPTATEGTDATLDFVVTVDPPVPGGQTITMNYSTYDGTAEEGKDYEYRYGRLAFTGGQHTKTVRVPVLHDSVDEDEEIVGFSIGSPDIGACCGNEVHATKRTAQGTINNLQSKLSVADASASESTDATMDFVVTLDPATTWPVSVKYETHDRTARSGRDYTYTRGTLRFDPYYRGETSLTVQVPIIDDSVPDDGETFVLRLSNATRAGLADRDATGTIHNTEERVSGPDPLTASFTGVLESHDGASAFTFGLTFSEEVKLSYRTLRDAAFNVGGGVVRKAKRRQQGSNQGWTITVEPDSSGAVAIRLPETSNCNASGAICTAAGQPLSHSLSKTVAGPVGFSVSDAHAAEAKGKMLVFVVTLSGAVSNPLTVDYSTADGSARAGVDYTPMSGTLTFGAGESSKTVEVAVLDDAHGEGEETLTLSLSNASAGRLTNGQATGTIENRNRLLDFPHFVNGEGTTSDLVFVNVETTKIIRPALYFYDTEGAPIAAESVVEVTGDLEITEDGGLTVWREIEPLGVLTISTHGQGEVVTGSVKVLSEGPIGAMLPYNLPGIGEAVVGTSPPLGDALFPVRRQEGGITTRVALHNLESSPGLVRCDLMREGVLLDAVPIPLEANGQTSWLIDQAFPDADTSEFVGSVRCDAVGEELFSAVALEMDPGTRTFITLPVFPVPEMPDRE